MMILQIPGSACRVMNTFGKSILTQRLTIWFISCVLAYQSYGQSANLWQTDCPGCGAHLNIKANKELASGGNQNVQWFSLTFHCLGCGRDFEADGEKPKPMLKRAKATFVKEEKVSSLAVATVPPVSHPQTIMATIHPVTNVIPDSMVAPP